MGCTVYPYKWKRYIAEKKVQFRETVVAVVVEDEEEVSERR